MLGNLHFRHVDPAQKSFGITMARGRSLAGYREEAEKAVGSRRAARTDGAAEPIRF